MTVKKYLKESIKLGDKDLTVETGRVAKQADGSVVIQYGDTMLLVKQTTPPAASPETISAAKVGPPRKRP